MALKKIARGVFPVFGGRFLPFFMGGFFTVNPLARSIGQWNRIKGYTLRYRVPFMYFAQNMTYLQMEPSKIVPVPMSSYLKKEGRVKRSNEADLR